MPDHSCGKGCEHPRSELVSEAQGALDKYGPDAVVHFKFSCSKCNARCLIQEKNTLYERAVCPDCGHDQPIKIGGFLLAFCANGNDLLNTISALKNSGSFQRYEKVMSAMKSTDDPDEARRKLQEGVFAGDVPADDADLFFKVWEYEKGITKFPLKNAVSVGDLCVKVVNADTDEEAASLIRDAVSEGLDKRLIEPLTEALFKMRAGPLDMLKNMGLMDN